jgi:hypothetical protein
MDRLRSRSRIHMEPLRLAALSTSANPSIGGSVFGNALHYSIGVRAHRPETNGRRLTPKGLASFAIEALWVAAVGALFFGWLMSRQGSDSSSGRGPECVSFRRAGSSCAERASNRDKAVGGSPRHRDYANLGKAGLVCFPGSNLATP